MKRGWRETDETGRVVDSSSTRTRASREGVKRKSARERRGEKELDSKLKRMVVVILDEYTRLKYR